MNILVTGAQGFLGRHLVLSLSEHTDLTVMQMDTDTTADVFKAFCEQADFVFHLAGVNRPQQEQEFWTGNADLTARLIAQLESTGRSIPILLSSSIQAEQNNPYGLSKKAGEDLVLDYARRNHVDCYVYRFPNIFGKWSRPYYNSAVATFCYRTARQLPLDIHDPKVALQLVYIDDVINELQRALKGQADQSGDYCRVRPVHSITVGELAATIQSFAHCRTDLSLPEIKHPLIAKLYSTYLSFLPSDQLSYPLKMNSDSRGSFTEFIRTDDRGQFSVNISKPGIVKGNHWHHSKHEKFLVVSGEAIIRIRPLAETDIYEYRVSGSALEVIEIQPGCTHNIENVGSTDLVTVMWASEAFDPNRPDTHYLEV